MSLFDRLKRWLERTLQKEQEDLSRKKRFLLNQLRLLIYVVREVSSGEYPVRAAALVFATLLAIVPVVTVGFSFFRAFGGLQEGEISNRVKEELTGFLLGQTGENGGGERPDNGQAEPADPQGDGDGAPAQQESGESAEADAPTELLADQAPRDGPPGEENDEDHLAERRRLITEWTTQISDTIGELVDTASGARMNLVSVIFLVFSSVLLFNTIETTFNRIWRVRGRRSFWVKFPVFFTILILGPVLLAAGMLLAAQLRPTGYSDVVGPFGRGVIARLYSISATTLAFFIVFKLLPYTKVAWRPALTGAVVAAVVWELAKWGFGVYVYNAITYSRIYGSLAAFPMFLMWLYLTWTIVLFGAGLSYVTQNIERITERERPVSPPLSAHLAVAVMLAVGRRFEKGEQPADAVDLSDELNARLDDVQATVADLADAGFLVSAGDDTEEPILPARPLDTVTLHSVLARVRRANADVFHPRRAAQSKALEKLFDQLDQREDDLANKVTLRDVVQEIARAEAGGDAE